MSYDTCVRCGASFKDFDTIKELKARLAACEEVLRGGYEQGANGLVVDRNKATAALKEPSRGN